MKKKVLVIVLSFVVAVSFLPVIGGSRAAYASYDYSRFSQIMGQVRSEYPEGTLWSNANSYPSGWSGCWAFANLCADRVFGCSTPRNSWSTVSVDNVLPGDVITTDTWNGSGWTYGHTMFVINVVGNTITVVEGNYGTSTKIVHWERSFTKDSDSFTVYHAPNYDSAIAGGGSNTTFTSDVNEIKGVAGGIYLRGWTFNNNNVTQSTQVHVYLDGSVGSGAQSWAVLADKSRTDVDDYYHVGACHGFETTITGISAGNHTVYLYANDQYRNESAFIGSYNVTVSEVNTDKTGPAYSDFHVGELREGAFTVMAKVTDPSGIKEVKYAIWTDKNGQDDITWYQGNCTDDNGYYWARVNFADHNGEKGTYTIHMYAYDNKDNLTNPGISYTFKETGPTISNVVVSDVTATGYTVTCTVKDEIGVLRVQFPTWTEKNGQDDIASDWTTNAKVAGTKSGESYSFRVNASEHASETGNYITHIYAYDKIGNATSYAVPAINVHNHSWDTGKTTKAATCTDAGVRTYKCTVCGSTKTESISATGHKWGAWVTTKEPTTTATGREERKCSVCATIEQNVLPKKTDSGSSESSDNPTDPEESTDPTKPVVTPTGQNEKIDLPAVTISSAKAAKKAATVKWKKVSKKNQKKIAKIQIQYSTDKTFKTGVKTTTAKKNAASKKIKKLTSKKTYYVRVRAYKKVGNVVHVSKWSKVKKAKIK